MIIRFFCSKERCYSNVDVSKLLPALYFVSDDNEFSNLFYVEPGAVLCNDPSRPSLEC